MSHVKQVSLNGRSYQVARGFNMYIDITSACNGACSFCIAPTVGRKDGGRFFEGAAFALDLAEQVGGSVQIVGGEPSISRRLPALLNMVGEHTIRRTVLNTNGTALTDRKIEQMKTAGVRYVNISRHHFDERRNQGIMRLRPMLSNAGLASAVDRITRAGIGVRMQCNLIKGEVDSVQKMTKYTDWCASIGCNTISFSQVFPLNAFGHQVPLEPGYTEQVQIDLRALVTEMDAGDTFVPAAENRFREEGMSAWGGGHIVSAKIGGKRRFWTGPSGTFVSLKTLSGYDEHDLPRPTVYRKEDDWELRDGLLAFAVVHPDGRVTASWDSAERVLFDPQQVVVRTIAA